MKHNYEELSKKEQIAEFKKMQLNCSQLEDSLDKVSELFNNKHKTAFRRFKSEIEKVLKTTKQTSRKRDLKLKAKIAIAQPSPNKLPLKAQFERNWNY